MTKRLLASWWRWLSRSALPPAAARPADSSSGSSGSPLVGAGSTLVAPLMSKWQSDYASKSEETVTYGAIGSGGGIDQITSRTVDFGASDAPLTEEQFEEARRRRADSLGPEWHRARLQRQRRSQTT